MPKQVLPVYNINTLSETLSPSKDLTADGFAHYLDTHKNLRFPHRHSFYHLVYFSKGSGTHTIDFVEFPVEPGQVYFMIPGQVHGWDFKKAPDGYIVNFSEPYISTLLADAGYVNRFSFFSGVAAQQVIDIPLKSRKAIEEILQTIVAEGNSSAIHKDDFVRTALIQLFISVDRIAGKESTKQSGNYNSLLLQNFRRLIGEHYKQKKLTKDYAALLYVTPNHLNALCKDLTGESAGELIRNRIILEAKRLLINASLTITQISNELEFTDNSYFSKFFKKYEGVTPELFRKQFIK